MRTVILIAIGLLLLAIFCLIGHYRSGKLGVRYSARVFIGLWLIAALVNLGIGVLSAGYTIVEELPFFLAVFGVPAIVAFVIANRVKI